MTAQTSRATKSGGDESRVNRNEFRLAAREDLGYESVDLSGLLDPEIVRAKQEG
jgi:hypothetical protein